MSVETIDLTPAASAASPETLDVSGSDPTDDAALWIYAPPGGIMPERLPDGSAVVGNMGGLVVDPVGTGMIALWGDVDLTGARGPLPEGVVKIYSDFPGHGLADSTMDELARLILESPDHSGEIWLRVAITPTPALTAAASANGWTIYQY